MFLLQLAEVLKHPWVDNRKSDVELELPMKEVVQVGLIKYLLTGQVEGSVLYLAQECVLKLMYNINHAILVATTPASV